MRSYVASYIASFLTLTYLGTDAGAVKMSNLSSNTIIHESSEDWKNASLEGVKLTGSSLISIGESGSITSEVLQVSPFDELIPSWNSFTGESGSLSLEVRVKVGADWSGWYSFGKWSKADGRSSLEGQKDATARVLTDTLRLSKKASYYQYRVTLHGTGTSLRLVAFNTTDKAAQTLGIGKAGDPKNWNKVINVQQRSQMIYPNGGDVWCSPTSVSMIMQKHGVDVTVPQAAKGMYDKAYAGTGNWPFNTAYAGEMGMRAFITRLDNLAAAEKYIAAGFPLALSLGWKNGELVGAPLNYSSGHLMVLVGFDAKGNPVLNDPAAPNSETVRRVYSRATFEKLWLTHSGGISYIITPQDAKLP